MRYTIVAPDVTSFALDTVEVKDRNQVIQADPCELNQCTIKMSVRDQVISKYDLRPAGSGRVSFTIPAGITPVAMIQDLATPEAHLDQEIYRISDEVYSYFSNDENPTGNIATDYDRTITVEGFVPNSYGTREEQEARGLNDVPLEYLIAADAAYHILFNSPIIAHFTVRARDGYSIFHSNTMHRLNVTEFDSSYPDFYASRLLPAKEIPRGALDPDYIGF